MSYPLRKYTAQTLQHIWVFLVASADAHTTYAWLSTWQWDLEVIIKGISLELLGLTP